MSWGGIVERRWFSPVACLAWGQWEIWVDGPNNLVGPRWSVAAAAAASSAALWWRRPRAVGVTVTIGVIVAPGMLIWGASETTSTLLPAAVAIYTAGRFARRPVAYLALGASMLLVLLQQATDPLITDFGSSWNWAVVPVVPFGLGAWLRQHDALARRRDAEAKERLRGATAEERLRIARDVHDVLAHSIGVMVVQAEAASEMLGVDPVRAGAPVQAVQETGRRALHEVRALLHVLRDDEDVPGASTVSIADVASLVERVRSAGLPVELVECIGPVPPAAGLTAYRVVQESLTNVVRHAGDVATTVRLTGEDGGLVVSVENDGPPVVSVGSGHGIVGMRERVHALGGTLTAGPRSDGGFAVRAVIPVAP